MGHDPSEGYRQSVKSFLTGFGYERVAGQADEITDWLTINGEYINVQRLSALQLKYIFNAGPQLSAVAAYLSQNKEYGLKWSTLSGKYKNKEQQILFYTLLGKPIPVSKEPDKIFLSKGLLRNKVVTRH